MKTRGVWKVYPDKRQTRTFKKGGALFWDIFWWVDGRTQASTVAEVAKKFAISEQSARTKLEALYKAQYLTKKSVTFWNGMHYARRHYYW